MESNPEEFFEGAPKWKFMFNANFREVLTEPEKGALHEALKEVRRKEFDTLVVKELMKEEMEDTLTLRASGRYQLSDNTLVGAKPYLSIGNQTLNEEEIARLKATQLNATPTSTGWFK
jgi:hypothetical protein